MDKKYLIQIQNIYVILEENHITISKNETRYKDIKRLPSNINQLEYFITNDISKKCLFLNIKLN